MAHGILPAGGGADRQPQGVAEIDWGKPLVQRLGLSGAVSGNGVYQTPAGIKHFTRSGTQTPDGRGFVGNGTNAYWSVAGDTRNYTNTVLVAVVTPYEAPASGYAGIVYHGHDNTDPIRPTFRICLNTAGSLVAVSSSSNGSFVSSTDSVNRVGKRTVVVAVRSGGSFYVYADSVLIGTGSSSGDSSDSGVSKIFSIGVNKQSYGDYYFKGLVEYAALGNGTPAVAEIREISANPWQIFRDDTSGILIFDMGGTAGPTVLVASPGTLSLSGQANTFLRNLRLSADPGTLSLAGQAATLVVGAVYPLSANPGALSLAGQAATLVVNRIAPVLVADPGALSLAGQQVSTLYSRVVVANPGGLNLAGQAATLAVLASNLLVANPGALSLTGQAAELVVNRVTPVLVADPGTLALAGQQASILATRLLVASPGTLSLTGQQGTTAASRKLAADPGSLTLLGMAASLGNGLGVSNVYVKVSGAYVAASALRVKQGGVYVGGQAFVKQGGLYLPVMT